MMAFCAGTWKEDTAVQCSLTSLTHIRATPTSPIHIVQSHSQPRREEAAVSSRILLKDEDGSKMLNTQFDVASSFSGFRFALGVALRIGLACPVPSLDPLSH